MIEAIVEVAKSLSESKLAELVKDVPSEDLNLKDLDKPLSVENKKETEKVNLEKETENKELLEIKEVKTQNQKLEGKTHPETNVPFEQKIVENQEGEQIKVVVPSFDSTFDAQLEPELYEATDKNQFKECNNQLKEEMQNNPDLDSKFTSEQKEQILDGETPDGYTWHHDAEKGKMELVDSDIHAKTGHTGGKFIWGGGSESR